MVDALRRHEFPAERGACDVRPAGDFFCTTGLLDFHPDPSKQTFPYAFVRIKVCKCFIRTAPDFAMNRRIAVQHECGIFAVDVVKHTTNLAGAEMLRITEQLDTTAAGAQAAIDKQVEVRAQLSHDARVPAPIRLC